MVDLALAQQVKFSRWKNKEGQKPINRTLPTRWKPPEQGKLKLNVDASWSPGDFSGSAAGILRDSSGTVADGFVVPIRALSPQHAEALALLQGLKFLNQTEAMHVGLGVVQSSGCTVESDSLISVDAVMGRAESSWDIKAIIEQCKEELPFIKSVKGVAVTVEHCLREANRAADWLANSHRSKNLPANWVNYPPLFLSEILCSEFYPSLTCKARLVQ
ncbi:hypothetical protein ACJRO7_026179 [Eucalyptus globulus]|uniref:RNase H type-1 domain-containing protein n=1 Tax=Eucalyptus globulus TaxID=34317 RepID=A0ABD3KBV7_EUCGL